MAKSLQDPKVPSLGNAMGIAEQLTNPVPSAFVVLSGPGLMLICVMTAVCLLLSHVVSQPPLTIVELALPQLLAVVVETVLAFCNCTCVELPLKGEAHTPAHHTP
jgi:Na+/alanine symporter